MGGDAHVHAQTRRMFQSQQNPFNPTIKATGQCRFLRLNGPLTLTLTPRVIPAGLCGDTSRVQHRLPNPRVRSGPQRTFPDLELFFFFVVRCGKLVTGSRTAADRALPVSSGLGDYRRLQLLVRTTTCCHVRPRHVSESSVKTPHLSGGFLTLVCFVFLMILDPEKNPHELFRAGSRMERGFMASQQPAPVISGAQLCRV